MPTGPGVYEYASDKSSIFFRQPMFQDTPFRYIQFEVSLYNNPYNDNPTPTLPQFNEFRIEYEPVGGVTEGLKKPVEIWPIPARDILNIKFEVIAEGAEVTVRIYNVAAILVAKEGFQYPAGGVQVIDGKKDEILKMVNYANGVYIFVIEGLSSSGGPGLIVDGEARKKVQGKFVVRRP